MCCAMLRFAWFAIARQRASIAGLAIRLTFHRPENLRDESARIGPATMHAYACGSKRAIAAVEGWGPLLSFERNEESEIR